MERKYFIGHHLNKKINKPKLSYVMGGLIAEYQSLPDNLTMEWDGYYNFNQGLFYDDLN